MAGGPDFERLHREREEGSRRAEDDRQEAHAFLERLAGDPSGTRLEDYLSADEVRMAKDFLEAQSRRSHPGSQAFKFEEVLAKMFERRVTRKRWTGAGYKIGRLSMVNAGGTSEVILCVDGTLRCERNNVRASLFHGATPRFSGYGRLPEPEGRDLTLTTGYNELSHRGEGGGFKPTPLRTLLMAIAEGSPLGTRPRTSFLTRRP